MPLAKYTKTPVEIKRYSVDYDDWLDTGEQLLGVDFVALPVTTPPLAASGLAFEVGSRAIQFLVSGGVDDVQYELLLTATTSNGQIKEAELLYVVREL